MTKRSLADALASALRDHQAGRLGAAERAYRKILAAAPAHPEAQHLLGILAHQSGRNDEALRLIDGAVATAPGNGHFHNNRGNVLLALGRPREAAAAFERAVGCDAALVEAHYNLGNARTEAGDAEGALAAYGRALALHPGHVFARNNLGNLLVKLGRYREGAGELARAASLAPDSAQVHANLAEALARLDRYPAAFAAIRRAIQLDPANPLHHLCLGNLHGERGEDGAAARAFEEAARLDPGLPNTAGLLLHARQRLCDWRDLDDLMARALEAVRRTPDALTPFQMLSLPVPPGRQLECARAHFAQRLGHVTPLPPPPPPTSSGDGRITLGYLSPDFRRHAVASLTVELFERHDRTRFRVLGYSTAPDDGSPIRRRIEAAFDRFVDLRGAPFEAAARRIRADGVDILIDLGGYTRSAPEEIVAYRPAPVQVSYLGFPGTLGSPAVDYIVVDPFVVPPDHAGDLSEAPVYLPECFQVNDGRRPCPDRGPGRAAAGLPPDGFVFCCFNNPYKILPPVFDAWMRVLKATEGSVLWLPAPFPETAANLRREAEVLGVDPGRLVFSPTRPYEEYLASYRDADLFLDTGPYNAGTTASDALWMGCPVVTTPGESFVSRMGGSLVRAVGLPELVAPDLERYVDLAVRLARDRDAHADLKRRLEANRATAPLFDCGRFTRHLEAAFTAMASHHRTGRTPEPIHIAP